MFKIKKRYWILGGLLGLLFFLVRCEDLKMRYEPEALLADLEQRGITTGELKQTTFQDNTLQYLKIGQDIAKPTVVFLHGSPGALSAFQPYYTDSLLLAKCNLISLDRPGFGYSNFGVAEPSLEQQAAALAQVLSEGPKSKVILVGHSMGGPVIARAAMDYPEQIHGLVMVAPAVSPALEPSNTWRRIVNFLPLRLFTPPALRVCNQEILPLKTELEEMLPNWAELRMPVTVVQGMEDALVPMGNASFVKEQMPSDSLVNIRYVEGGDHFILWSEVPLVRTEI
ncbi:MAG: alpha/beta hydrolase, partial [Bacteroidota bacterium]